jgi:hypothetical protein
VSSAVAQVVRIPNTSVAMTPPPGFRPGRAGGLEDTSGSTITFAEQGPEGYAQAIGYFASPKTASDAFAPQGIRIQRVDQVAVGAGQLPLAIGEQRQNDGRSTKKYISVVGGPAANANTVLIMFSVTPTGTLRQGDVEAALRTVRVAQVVTIADKVAGLPFKFNAVAPFRTADVLQGPQAFLTAYEGQDPSGNKPMILIGRASTSSTASETAQAAERVLRNMSGFADAEITERGAVQFAGGDGHYLTAVAGNRSMVQFLRVFSNGTYLRLVARGETSEIDAVRPAIKEIADSVTLSE